MGSRASHPPRNLYASWSVRPTSTEEAEMISAVLERQREPPRSLRGSGAARSGLRGRGLGGRHRPPPPTPLASHLRHFPRAPGRGHPRCPATDGSLEHRHDHAVPAPVRRGPHRGHRPGLPGKLRGCADRSPRSPNLARRSRRPTLAQGRRSVPQGAPHQVAALWARATAPTVIADRPRPLQRRPIDKVAVAGGTLSPAPEPLGNCFFRS